MNETEDLVRLKHHTGELSDWMPRERAAFIVAFTLTGERPQIIERDGREVNERKCNE